jgi:DNA-binding transcriptional LysR family regulator
LTEAGRYFVEQVTLGIDQLDHAVKTVGVLAKGDQGRVRIGVHALIPGSFLANVLIKYREKYASVSLDIIEGSARDLGTQLRNHEIDVAFVVGGMHVPDCHSRLIWREPISLVLPCNHPLVEREVITWFDLVLETFLVQRHGIGPQVFDHVVRRIAERRASPQIHCRDVGRDTLMHMIAAGDGITLLPRIACYGQPSGVTFREINDETEQAELYAMWSPQNCNPAFKSLLDFAGQMAASA